MFAFFNVGEIRYNRTEVRAPLKLIQKITDLILFVEVDAKTADAKMSRYFAENGTELFCVHAPREARLFFLVQPIKFLICDVFVVADVVHAEHSKLSRVRPASKDPSVRASRGILSYEGNCNENVTSK